MTSMPPHRRWCKGMGYHTQVFYRAIKKHGWDNFKHEILLEGLTKEEAELAERLFIGYWNLTDNRYGYNIELGGDSIGKVSEETKKKISRSMKGCNHPNRGKPMSKGQKKKISASMRGEKNSMYGRQHTPSARAKMADAKKRIVCAIDINTNEIVAVYDSAKSAQEKLGVNRSSISACCHGKVKTAGGYRWEFYQEK